jgi:hypothetical protein
MFTGMDLGASYCAVVSSYGGGADKEDFDALVSFSRGRAVFCEDTRKELSENGFSDEESFLYSFIDFGGRRTIAKC